LKNLSFGENREDNISGLSTDAETEIEETLALKKERLFKWN
jgi:hypothetical protein